jgi:hypothetical protein
MVKKIVLGVLLFGLIGILVAGAVIRTMDKTGNVAEARGEGRGRAGGADAGLLATGEECGSGQQGGGHGRSSGSGSLATEEQVVEDWTAYEGTVVQAPAAGSELVIETEDGEEIVAGTGPGYLADQGFVLGVGDEVQVQGYWQDDEFKAAQITRLKDSQTIQLRDQLGRPAWSGSGRRAEAQGNAGGGQGQGNAGGGLGQGNAGGGQGQGNAGGGQGQGNTGGGQGQGNLSGDQAGMGQAQVDEWLTLEAVVTGVDSAALAVSADNGEEIVLDGRPWRYLLEQGFQVAVGDRVKLVGFYENGSFEAGAVTNLSTGQQVLIRDENGRPLWAGRGRGGS